MITVCLLNYRRPGNLERILPALQRQTTKPTIFLWDNAADSDYQFEWPDIDWVIRSSVNQKCPPRWHMAVEAETPWVMSLDDDLLPTDDRLLELAVERAEREPPDRAVGPFGFVLNPDKHYVYRKEGINMPAEDRAVDLVKGRLLMIRTATLRAAMQLGDLCGPLGREDDLAICGRLAAGRKLHHLCPAVFHGRLKNLPEGAEGISADKGAHYARRERARRHWGL